MRRQGAAPIFAGAPLAALLALSSATAEAREPATLTTHGYGAIAFGDKLAAVEVRLKQKARAADQLQEPSCRFVAFGAYPGLIFMVEDGVITRADMNDGAKVRTELGVTMGDAFAGLPARFPALRSTPNPYSDEERNWVYAPEGEERALIVVEGADGRVSQVHAGRAPSVYYDEGCS